MNATQRNTTKLLPLQQLGHLLEQKNRAGKIVAKAQDRLNAFLETLPPETASTHPRFLALQSAQEKAAMEWEEIYHSILTYEPVTIREAHTKMIAMLDLLSEGYDNPLIMFELRRLVTQVGEDI